MVSVAVVPTPTTIPESPEYVVVFTVSVNRVGGSMRTAGGFVDVYPVPGPVTVIVFTTPAEIVDVADHLSVDPSPTGLCKVTTGADEYPKPPLVISIELIVPADETIAVAAAATKEF